MRVSREWLTVDVVAAAALMVASLLEIWAPLLVPGVGAVHGDHVTLSVTAVASTLPLALRRRWPLAVLVVVIGSLCLQQLLTIPTEGLVPLLAAMLAAYSSSAYDSVVRAAVGGGVLVAGAAVIGRNVGDWAFLATVLGGAWLVGFVVMQRSADLRRAHEDNRQLAERLALAARRLEEAERQQADSTAGLADLTPREVDVVRGIAEGKSNGEIAAELYISEWTVKTHVGHVLRKLGLRDRAQVVVAAYESGLVRPRTDDPRREGRP